MLVLGVAAPAYAAPPAGQIAALNAQREANGIPAGIVERREWTEGCRKHMAYVAANGGTLTHDEQPGLPGYTEMGAMVGRRSVITPLGEAFNSAGNAFEFAPLHLMQTLAPALSEMGVWGGCATTNLGYQRAARRPALYTYPGDRATSVYASEQAFELPFVPGDFVGLPQGTTTGPHLYLMSHGTGPGRITSAVVSGPSGPVAIRAVDNETAGLEGYMPPGAIVIPVDPLAAGASYQVSATFQPTAGGAALSRSWSFETAQAAPLPAAPAVVVSAPTSGSSSGPGQRLTTLALSNPRPTGRSVAFTLSADSALVGRRAQIRVVRLVRHCAAGVCRDRQKGRRMTSVIGRLATTQTITAPRPAAGRIVRVQVVTRPFDTGGVAFAAGSADIRWLAR